MSTQCIEDPYSPDWLALRSLLWPDCDPDEHLRQMQLFVGHPERFVQFIARSPDGQAVGLAEASIRSDYVNGTESSPVAFLEGLFVKPESRSRGVARSLLQAVSTWAVERGCTELASDTPIGNLAGQRVHERLGFAETPSASSTSEWS